MMAIIDTSNPLKFNAKPSSQITREEISKDESNVRSANDRLRICGKMLKPSGSDYMGSVALHYFERMDNAGKLTYHFAVMDLLGSIDETTASFGVKELTTRMMQHYGRKQGN